MTSISVEDLARRALDACLEGRAPAELPAALIDDPGGEALFGIFAEGLADRFDPVLCQDYLRLFAKAVERVWPRADADSLIARYQRVRQTRPVDFEPPRVFVLSRVTLGADVAVTSVLMDAAKRRFPNAEIVFAGPAKNFEMFAGDPRVCHLSLAYRRGALGERLSLWPELARAIAQPDALVIDPDSRLTQLGLLPVCPDERYRFFESRAYGGGSAKALPELAAEWAFETLGVAGAKPYLALENPEPRGSHIAVSFGVGENPAKRLPDPFEEELLRMLAASGAAIHIDKGAGGGEAARVTRAVERSGARATFWDGSFAGFARIIASARLYLGYDSAGQHAASASGVPLISIFAGFPSERMFHRWRPCAAGATVIRVDARRPQEALERVRAALSGLLTT